MRICYLADARYIHAERWMRFFAARGHDMHLISFAGVSRERIGELSKLGIHYHGAIGNFHVKKFWLTLRNLKFIRKILREERIEILHSHYLGANAWYGAMSQFRPYIITIMGGDVTGEGWRPNGNLQERYLTPYTLKNADTITAWSPNLAERVKPYLTHGRRVEIVHGGVELVKFFPGEVSRRLKVKLAIPADGKVVFSPRLIRPLYNIDMIAHSADLVCKNEPTAYFVVALPETILDTEFVDKVKRIFSMGSAKENVRYVPTIVHDEMADFMRTSDVVVSVPNTDGTPMAVLESMACGTPTVIGNLPDYDREYFENEKTTIMVDVKDPRSIADGILRSLTDPKLSRAITEEARRRVEKIGSYEFQMSKMEAIYMQLANK